MFSAVASGIFAARNIDKTRNGDVGRSAVALGQTAGVVQEVAKYDNIVAKGARSAVSVFSNLAKEHKAFEYAGKVTKFAIDNVNPLICASGVIKTAMADDKVKTGITEVAALGTMFAGEALIKDYYSKAAKSKTLQNTIKKASETELLKPVFKYTEKHKLNGKIGSIIKGLTFIAGSMTAYSIGHSIGNNVADKVETKLGIKPKTPKKIDQKM